nr:hypothetical protein [Kitasatospora aureofaciens]
MTTILPNCALDSMCRCACTTSSSGRMLDYGFAAVTESLERLPEFTPTR